MALERIVVMLESCATDSPLFPQTLLYREGWLLRLVLDWFSRHKVANHPLGFAKDARWFSEAWLPSAFLPRDRGDQLAESWTRADGVIGHFAVGNVGKADLQLLTGGTQLVVLEAKMFSRLSSHVTHASYYDQAARTVGCIAEVLKRALRDPSKMTRLGFYVLAPESQIARGVFRKMMNPDSIRTNVERRIREYEDGEKEKWFRSWFTPTLRGIEVRSLSWEELIATIAEIDPKGARSIREFYKKCVQFDQ